MAYKGLRSHLFIECDLIGPSGGHGDWGHCDAMGPMLKTSSTRDTRSPITMKVVIIAQSRGARSLTSYSPAMRESLIFFRLSELYQCYGSNKN